MKNKYIDLIEQTFEFPQAEFKVIDNELYFNNVSLMDIIKQYGTPLRISYLPKITSQVQRAKRMFNVAMAKVDYQGDYHYCYCTKSSHFSFVLEQVLKNEVHLETSSAFDINIIEDLAERGLFAKDRFIICNGFKRPMYIENIVNLVNNGFTNVIPVLDNLFELEKYEVDLKGKMQLGIRIASEEEPKFDFYTSRLGVRYNDIIPYYIEKIKDNPRFELKMLHFFINTGIKDKAYYWNELTKSVNV
jgi:arginine decarboxylase